MRILGKPIKYSKDILKNSKINLNLTITDGLGTEFKAVEDFQSDSNGKLFISENQMRNFIAKAQPGTGFILIGPCNIVGTKT